MSKEFHPLPKGGSPMYASKCSLQRVLFIIHKYCYTNTYYLETFGSSTFLINFSKGTLFFVSCSRPPGSSLPGSKSWSNRYCKIFCTTKFDGLSLRKVFQGCKKEKKKLVMVNFILWLWAFSSTSDQFPIMWCHSFLTQFCKCNLEDESCKRPSRSSFIFYIGY